jgi:hypothetical protein
MPLTKRERIEASAANRSTIMDRIANSNYTTDMIPKGIMKGIARTNIKLFVVNDGSSSYFHIGGGILIVSVEQALKIANVYDMTLSQGLESIICHELGHHLMFLADIPQPQEPYVERLAWLLGRQFLELTSVPPNTYLKLSVELN